MIVRELRVRDAADLLGFLQRYFPEEEALLGTRPEGFLEIVRRLFRWDVRLVLALLRLVRRPIFRFFVIEDGGRLVATTLLTFSKAAGYVSMVVVDPAYRRRGLARELLDRARRATRSRGKPFLVLDVLAANAPARALYERIGFRTLRATAYYVQDAPESLLPGPTGIPGIRPFDRRDAPALAAIAGRGRPPEVERVLPSTPRELTGSSWEGALLASELTAWVYDPGSGPQAWVSAAVSRATEAGHLSSPIVGPSVPAEAAASLVRTAAAWCAARRVPRVMTMVPEENTGGRAALEGVGFRSVIPVLTLYRSVA